MKVPPSPAENPGSEADWELCPSRVLHNASQAFEAGGQSAWDMDDREAGEFGTLE